MKKHFLQQSSTDFSPSSRSSYSFPFLQIPDGKPKSIYICNTFINLFFDKTYIELLEKDCYYRSEELFDVYRQKIFKYKLYSESEIIKKYFFDKIAKGYCIICHWDEFYIMGSPNYKLQHTDTECMIFDFATDGQTFSIFSIKNCRVVQYVVTIEQFLCSINHQNVDDCSFCFIRFNPESTDRMIIYTEKIKDDIMDYLNSSCRFIYFPNSTQYFGIQAMKHFYDYVNDKIHQCELFGNDNVFVLLDHKKCFYQRLMYLEEKGLITNERWYQKYYPILKMAEEFNDYCFQFYKEGRPGENNKYPEKTNSFSNLIYAEEELLYELVKRGFVS